MRPSALLLRLTSIPAAITATVLACQPSAAGAACTSPTVIAHRGVGVGSNENTLWSVGRAAASGAVWIETDVRTTRDHVPVIMHDATLNRTTYQTGTVARMTWREVQAARERTDRERVPSEVQFLRRVQTTHLRLLLELKAPMPDDVVRSAVRNVFRADMWRRTVVHSFDPHLLRVARSFSTSFGRRHGVAALRTAWLTMGVDTQTIDAAHAAGVNWLEPIVTFVVAHPETVATAKRAGFRVMVWTADTADQWKALQAAGVSGIITDEPARLRTWEASHCG